MRDLSKAFVLFLDEALLTAIALFVLWKLGVDLSPVIVISVVVLMGGWLFMLHKLIVSLGRRKIFSGQEGMIGLEGIVVKPLSPEGVIQIHGELWAATSTCGGIQINEEVVVIGMEALKLFVTRKDNAGKSG